MVGGILRRRRLFILCCLTTAVIYLSTFSNLWRNTVADYHQTDSVFPVNTDKNQGLQPSDAQNPDLKNSHLNAIENLKTRNLELQSQSIKWKSLSRNQDAALQSQVNEIIKLKSQVAEIKNQISKVEAEVNKTNEEVHLQVTNDILSAENIKKSIPASAKDLSFQSLRTSEDKEVTNDILSAENIEKSIPASAKDLSLQSLRTSEDKEDTNDILSAKNIEKSIPVSAKDLSFQSLRTSEDKEVTNDILSAENIEKSIPVSAKDLSLQSLRTSEDKEDNIINTKITDDVLPNDFDLTQEDMVPQFNNHLQVSYQSMILFGLVFLYRFFLKFFCNPNFAQETKEIMEARTRRVNDYCITLAEKNPITVPYSYTFP